MFKKINKRTQGWLGTGVLITALLSSACCWLPFLFIGLGVSGVAVSAAMEKYRLPLSILTFILLGAAFYFAYRPCRVKTFGGAGSEDCCQPGGEADACCAPGKRQEINLNKLNKAILWIITPLALALVFFPGYSGLLLAGSSLLVDGQDAQRCVIKVGGMTCDGCAATLQGVLKKVPGVNQAAVSYKEGQAVITLTPDRVGESDLQQAVEKAGYKAISFQLIK